MIICFGFLLLCVFVCIGRTQKWQQRRAGDEAAAAEHDSREPCASIKELAAKHPKLTRIGWQPDSPQADADSATKLTAEDVYARLCRLGLRHPAPVSAQGVEVKTRAARFRTLAGLATP